MDSDEGVAARGVDRISTCAHEEEVELVEGLEGHQGVHLATLAKRFDHKGQNVKNVDETDADMGGSGLKDRNRENLALD